MFVCRRDQMARTQISQKNIFYTNQNRAYIQLEVGDIDLSEVGKYPGKHSKEENLFEKGSPSFVEELQMG